MIHPYELPKVAAVGNGRVPGMLVGPDARPVPMKGYVNFVTIERRNEQRDVYSLPLDATLGPGYVSVSDYRDRHVYSLNEIARVEVVTSERYADMRTAGYTLTAIGGTFTAAGVGSAIYFFGVGDYAILGALIISLPLTLTGSAFLGGGIPLIKQGNREPPQPQWIPAPRPWIPYPAPPGSPPAAPRGPVGATLSWSF